MPVVLYLLLYPAFLGRLHVDSLVRPTSACRRHAGPEVLLTEVPVTLIVGALLGHLFCQTFNTLWMAKKAGAWQCSAQAGGFGP